MSYVEEIDRLTAERDAARENARIRTQIAWDLDRLNQEAIAKAERERDRARDLAAHLEAELARGHSPTETRCDGTVALSAGLIRCLRVSGHPGDHV